MELVENEPNTFLIVCFIILCGNTHLKPALQESYLPLVHFNIVFYQTLLNNFVNLQIKTKKANSCKNLIAHTTGESLILPAYFNIILYTLCDERVPNKKVRYRYQMTGLTEELMKFLETSWSFLLCGRVLVRYLFCIAVFKIHFGFIFSINLDLIPSLKRF